MKVAIRVHTPELSEAVQRLAFSYGRQWGGDNPSKIYHPSEGYDKTYCLGFNTITPEGKDFGRCSESFYKNEGHLILDAKTDMEQIVEFFKTGKIKESDMGKTTIKNTNGREFDVSRKGDEITIGCETFTVSELDKARKVKPKKVVKVEREIADVIFSYDSTRDPGRVADVRVAGDRGYVFSDSELPEIQAWLDEIKAAKKKAGLE